MAEAVAAGEVLLLCVLSLLVFDGAGCAGDFELEVVAAALGVASIVGAELRTGAPPLEAIWLFS